MSGKDGRPFTPHEDGVLAGLRAAGTSIRRIALAMERPASSIQNRLDWQKKHGSPAEEETDMAKKPKEELTTPDSLAEIEEGEIEKGAEVALETVSGDLRDFILDRLMHEQDKRPWNKRSELDQRETIHRTETAVREVVKKIVELIAANGRPVIKATLESVAIKDGIKATLSMRRDDAQRYALFDATGASLLIVVADPFEYEGERAPAEVIPDQPDLMDKAGAVHADTEAKGSPFH